MTLDELAASLPNGFHDAELKTLAIDYEKREVRLVLDLWVGDMGQDPVNRESYRLCEVLLSGLRYWIVEPPDPRYSYWQAGAPRIDAGPVERLETKTTHLPPTPPDVFVNWIYSPDSNSFAYVAAEQARLTWLGEKMVREYSGIGESKN